MAVTIIEKPNDIHSGYNPVKYVMDSSNKNKSGFRYVVEIFPKGGVDKIAEFNIIPDSLNSGYGEIDISRILQNRLDGFFTTSLNNPQNAIGAYFEYDIKIGESYNYEWEFNDYIFLPGAGLGLTTDSSYGAGFSDVAHNYQIGDQIKVTLNNDYPDNRDLLNTFFEVVEVVDSKTIRINVDYNTIGSFPATPGKTVFSDNRKLISYNQVSNTATAVNTALDIQEMVATQGSLDDYSITGGIGTKLILTNQPDKYSMTPEQYAYFNIGGAPAGARLVISNSEGESFISNTLQNTPVNSVGIGPGNLGTFTAVIGALPIIKPQTEYYEILVVDSDSFPLTQTYKVNLDKRCVINDTQILFMDRKGSYNSFAFQLKRRENARTEKNTFNKYINDYSSTTVKGETVYNSTVEKTINLATNYMGEQMNFYFEELMTSRHTYILWEGLWYACIIQDTTFENEFERNNKLINKSITAKFAVNNPIN